jgi:hypothetical protein
LNSVDVREKWQKKRNTNTYEQYVYALTCGTSCHQCIFWMIRAHSYTWCGSFFECVGSHERKGAQSSDECNDLAKASLALTRPPHPGSYVSSLLHLHGRRDARSGDPKRVPANIQLTIPL